MSFISKWKEKIAHYVDVRLGLLKLGIIERTSSILSYLIFVFIVLFLAVAILIFIGISIGEYFATVVDSKSIGFLITAGFYLLLILLMFLLRRPITTSFAGVFIRILTAGDEEDEKEEKSKSNIKVE